VAAPVRDAAGNVVAAVSVVAIMERIQEERARTISALLDREISRISIPAA
jgi:DNA-binding IclR family transcriptional regulator